MTKHDPRIAHLGVAVVELEAALAFFRDVLGITPSSPVTADGASIVSLRFGETEIELMKPVTSDGPVAKFIEKRGPGIHHVCVRVPHLDRALALCREHGYHLVDETPRPGAHGRRIAFVHPKTTGGILLELTE